MSHTWDRLEDEPDAAWKAFKAFRDQNRRPRRYRATGDRAATVYDWAKAFHWVARAKAYDAHIDAVVEEIRIAHAGAQVQDVTSELLDALSDARDVIGHELAKLANKARRDTDEPYLKPNELAKLMDLTMRYTQLLSGGLTDNVKTEIDLSNLDPTEQRALLASLRKAKGDKEE